jgi:hypothetical protein
MACYGRRECSASLLLQCLGVNWAQYAQHCLGRPYLAGRRPHGEPLLVGVFHADAHAARGTCGDRVHGRAFLSVYVALHRFSPLPRVPGLHRVAPSALERCRDRGFRRRPGLRATLLRGCLQVRLWAGCLGRGPQPPGTTLAYRDQLTVAGSVLSQQGPRSYSGAPNEIAAQSLSRDEARLAGRHAHGRSLPPGKRR